MAGNQDDTMRCKATSQIVQIQLMQLARTHVCARMHLTR